MPASSIVCFPFVHFKCVYGNIGTFLHSQKIGRVERRKGRRMEDKKHKKERWKGRWKDSMLLHFLEALSVF